MKRRDFLNNFAVTIAGSTLANLAGVMPVVASETSSTPASHPYDSNRVVRVYDPTVTNFGFKPEEVYWKTINPKVLTSMLDKTLTTLSGEKKVTKAWKKILAGSTSAQLSGKKVAVKVNFNNTIRDINQTLNVSPVMITALVQSLMGVGIAESDITIFDHSRPFPEDFQFYIRSNNLKNLNLKGKPDNLADSGKTILFTDNVGVVRPDGKKADVLNIPQCVIEADYLINLHLLKFHDPGITGAMKNLFGMASEVWVFAHNEKVVPFSKGNHLPEISLNEEIMKRSKLNLSECIFGGHTPDTIDKFTSEDFFPNGLPCSLVASTSPFYQDMVLYNMARAEYLTCMPVLKRFKTIGPDLWLQNSAKKYAPWKFGHAEYVTLRLHDMPARDLKFEQIDYISIRNS